MFSYISFEPGTSIITNIREKVAISRHANTGAYAFPCGAQLRNACRKVLDNPVGKAGEFYTSTIIAEMISAGQKVRAFRIMALHFRITFSCVGTPTQLRSFLESLWDGAVVPRHKARICFDLDRAL
ncbi:unnamed protein product, partial [Ascophyllum nodosum]